MIFQPEFKQRPLLKAPGYQSASNLGELCVKYEIHTTLLAQLAGCSRSAAYNLLTNKSNSDFAAKLHKTLAVSLPKYLSDVHGLSPAQIDEAVANIFTEGEYQPMINQRIELTNAELKFFNLSADPFSRPPQSREEVFVSPEFREIIDRVIDAVHYQGFIAVTGPIGAGKSTLRALIEDQIENNHNLRLVWPEFFDMAGVTTRAIAESILMEFNSNVPRSNVRMGNAVKSLLSNLYKDGKRIAIAFDEVHRLNDSALSSLKNFLEMNSGGFQRYLGVIMFGQPIFESRLRDPRFQELVERIVPIRMPEFQNSAHGYLEHRLKIIGADVNGLFDREALDLICNQAQTPLQLGNIANEALRISRDAFGNKQVIGSAIKTRMFFENRSQSFKRRAA